MEKKRQLADVVVIFFFFFFKQKTAYEILTCDWSSDVCSSDLLSKDSNWLEHKILSQSCFSQGVLVET